MLLTLTNRLNLIGILFLRILMKVHVQQLHKFQSGLFINNASANKITKLEKLTLKVYCKSFIIT